MCPDIGEKRRAGCSGQTNLIQSEDEWLVMVNVRVLHSPTALSPNFIRLHLAAVMHKKIFRYDNR